MDVSKHSSAQSNSRVAPGLTRAGVPRLDSLDLLVTLGVSALLMSPLERLWRFLRIPLLAFGRTALFAYLVHVYVVHGAALLLGVVLGVPAAHFVNFLGDPTRLAAAGWGVGLVAVYAVWLAVLIALFPLSRWFAEVKRRRRDRWLAFL